jgi:hypothetical protein
MADKTWCPQCGPGCPIDEDGCCTMCGAGATGPGAEQALRLQGDVERLERLLHATGENAAHHHRQSEYALADLAEAQAERDKWIALVDLASANATRAEQERDRYRELLDRLYAWANHQGLTTHQRWERMKAILDALQPESEDHDGEE